MLIEQRRRQMAWAKARWDEDKEIREQREEHLRRYREEKGKDGDASSWDVNLIDDERRVRVRALAMGLDEEIVEGESEERLFERIIDKRDLLPADFLRTGARVSAAVARIHVRDASGRRMGFGTGFMISDRLMMTNNHVLENRAECVNSRVEFDFLERFVDSARSTSFFGLDPQRFFLTNVHLDYTIVALDPRYDETQARRRRWLQLISQSGKLLVGERVNIVQHPRGREQEVGLRQNQLQSVRGDFLHYQTDTEPGSSGSPLCNDQWQLAGIHHAGVPERVNGQVRWVANEGVRISSIVKDVRERLQSRRRESMSLFDTAFSTPPDADPVDGPAPLVGAPAGTIDIPIRLQVTLASDPGAQVSSASSPPTKDAVPSAVAPPPPPPPSEPPNEQVGTPDGRPAFENARLECIITRMQSGAPIADLLTNLLPDWTSEPVEGMDETYDLLPPGEIKSSAEAWRIVYAVRDAKGVATAEPSWYVESRAEEEGDVDGLEGSSGGSDTLSRTWAPDLIEVEDAWKVPPAPGGQSRGGGIRVAHPDSGYTRHPELWERAGALDVGAGKDYVDDDPDPLDEDGFHGTGTASVLMSGEQAQVVGVAPDATLIPFRVAQKGKIRPAPVIWRNGTRHLRDAIRKGIQENCHVVSISLGWLGNSALTTPSSKPTTPT